MTVQSDFERARPCGDAEGASVERAVREHLEHLLSSPRFDGSARSRQFLTYVVNEVLANRGPQLDQTSIAVAVFGRTRSFDAVLDPIVRVQAGRLRRSLERYYLLTGHSEPCRIELRKGSYAPVFVDQATGPGARPTAVAPGTARKAEHDWPALLIHPFVVDSDEDQYAAAHIQDELTQELCHYGDLRVMRANELDGRQQAAVRFEFHGMLRRRADDCLVGARLVDRATGQQLWSEERHTTPGAGRWCSSVEDIARAMATRVGSEYGVIARVLAGDYAAGRLDPELPSTAIARCYHFFYSRNAGAIVPTIEALHRLTARVSEVGLAWVYLARLYLVNESFELSALETPLDRAIPYAYQGVLFDPASARARCILATALILQGEIDAALDELEQALRLNPDSLAYREINGWLTALAGKWERGTALMRESMERNPYFLPHVNHGLWADHLRRGEFEPAHRAALEYRDSAFFWRELMIACSRGLLGRTTEARANVAELLRVKPQFRERGRTLIGYYIKPTELRELVIEGLAKAGLALS